MSLSLALIFGKQRQRIAIYRCGSVILGDPAEQLGRNVRRKVGFRISRAGCDSIKQCVAFHYRRSKAGGADRPENTLASIRRAIEAGAMTVEVDVCTTSDDHLVILHDVFAWIDSRIRPSYDGWRRLADSGGGRDALSR